MALTPEKIEDIKKRLQGLSPEEQKAKFEEILQELSPEEREEIVGGQQPQQCPFCLMVQGEIPVKKLYEDEVCMAFLDINPANKGHTLLIPKDHVPVVASLNDADIGHIFKVANMISKALFEGLESQGTNIIVSNGPAAGQKAPHAIINIIPRQEGDKVSIAWEPQKAEEAELEEVLKKIVSKLHPVKKAPAVVEEPKKVERFDDEDLRIP